MSPLRAKGKLSLRNYELGDLTLALDKIVKDEVCKVTGKDASFFWVSQVF